MQSIQQKLQEEMEAKLQEKVEAIKTEMLSRFNLVLNKLQKCFPGVVIPDLSSMSVPSMNEREATDAHSLVVPHHDVVEKTREAEMYPKKSSTKQSSAGQAKKIEQHKKRAKKKK